MSMSNRMYDRLRKLYRLVLAHMRNVEAAIAAPASQRKVAGVLNSYAGHRLESLEPRTLLSSSGPGGIDVNQNDEGNSPAPIVFELIDGQQEMADDDQSLVSNANVALGVEITEATLVSTTVGGVPGNGLSTDASISADGNFIVFLSIANDLVAGDTNNQVDIFVYNRLTGEVERVSVGAGGTESDGPSYDATISEDGRYVSFTSEATNLVAGDTNGYGDVFVYDRQTDVIERVNVAPGDIEGNEDTGVSTMSADGRYVSFSSDASNLVAGDTNNQTDIFVVDRQTGVIQRVSVNSVGDEGNNFSGNSMISGNGRYVVFDSDASNLVAGDTNGTTDIFVHDLQTGLVERVNLGVDDTEADFESGFSVISPDGRYVSFVSEATNLVPGDTNNRLDIFFYDRMTGLMERVSVSDAGIEGNGDSESPVITPDGRFVSFESNSTNLVAGDTNGNWDTFVYDRLTQQIERVSLGEAGVQGNGFSRGPSISADGRYVSFTSDADNLIADDDNETRDVFVVDRGEAQAAEPEVEVSGNDFEILDDDVTPDSDDDTDFGVVTQDDAPVSRTFTVYNTGTTTLTTSDLSVPDGFVVTEGLSETIEAGESDTFTVELETVEVGTKSGDISFTTDDTDEETFNFAITGTVSEPNEVELPNLTATINDSAVVTSIVAGTATRIVLPVTVVNEGDVNLAANTRIAIEVYARPVGGGDDILLTTLTNQNVSGLKAGLSKKFNVIFTLPAEIETDDYVLVANIDSLNVVDESLEDDNEAEGTTVISIAEGFVNLTTTLDDSRIPASVLAGTATRLKLPITVTNGGNIALAANTRIAIEVYARPVEGGDDILLTTLSNQNVSGLKAGASKRFNAIFTLPADIDTDDYVLVANVDSDNVVEESLEDDNEAEGTTIIAIAEGFVDLSVAIDDSRIVTSIVAGTATSMKLPITVTNQGNIALAANTRIAIQVFARPVEGGDDVLLTTLSNQNVSGLKANSSKRFNAVFTLPAEIDTDDYVLVANVDSDNVVEETDEDDNEAEGTQTIAIVEGYVNLTPTIYDSRIPTSIVAGTATRIMLPITLCNHGNIALAANSRIDIQIYARPVEGGGDILLTTLANQNVSYLGAGYSRCFRAAFTLPAEIESDDYVLVVNVDSQNAVEESDEDDNEAEGTTEISIAEGFVNLTATLDDSRIPESIEAGSSTRIVLPITLTNGGNIALSSNVRIAIEVYARPVGGGADILLTTLTNQNISNLKAGSLKRVNAIFTMPAEIDSDDYVLVANVDSLNVLGESNEGDNLAVGTKVISVSGGDGGLEI